MHLPSWLRAWLPGWAKGWGQGWRIRRGWQRGWRQSIHGRHNRLEIQATCRDCRIEIHGDHNLVQIDGGGVLEGVACLRGGACLWLEDDGTSVHIGPRTALYGAVTVAASEGAGIEIGADCLIAPGVPIRSGDSHAILREGKRCNPARPVRLAQHIWLAEGAVVLKGVSLAPHCVVATRAVVSRSFDQEGCVLAGNPARAVKSGISWRADRRGP